MSLRIGNRTPKPVRPRTDAYREQKDILEDILDELKKIARNTARIP